MADERAETRADGGVFAGVAPEERSMTRWWLSCEIGTVEVSVDAGGIIRRAPPLVQKFLNQPLGALHAWMAKFANYECRSLDEQGDLFG
jgi:hypothetical protein